MPSVRGRLLVATPELTDPNFFRTVVLVLEHNADGAFGIVLNRPTRAPYDGPLGRWVELAAPPAVVFIGGPVQPDAVITLGALAPPATGGLGPGAAQPGGTGPGPVGPGGTPGGSVEGVTPLLDGIGAVDLHADPALVAGAGLERLRVFVGYAGWGPGQLDAELAAGGWFVVDAEPGDPFGPDATGLWSRVLARQPGRLRIFAHCPPDPSVN